MLYNIKTNDGELMLCEWVEQEEALEWFRYYRDKYRPGKPYPNGRGKYADRGFHIVDETEKEHPRACKCGMCIKNYLTRGSNMGVVHRHDKSVPECIPMKIELTWWEREGMHTRSYSDHYGHDKQIAAMLDRECPIEDFSRIAHIK